MAPLVAGTSYTGFFQPQPQPQNQWTEDASLQRAANLFLPADIVAQISPELDAFGKYVLSKEVLEHVVNAEHDLPRIAGSGFTSFGSKLGDALITAPGWKALQAIGIQEGIVARGYDEKLGAHARMAQLLKMNLWASSSAIVTCPSAMQDGAVVILKRELHNNDKGEEQRLVVAGALKRLLSTDPKTAWTAGQWMTERPGGSDVSGSESVATLADPIKAVDADGRALGPYNIDGFKWFSSATDSGCVVLLAKTEKGLSTFFAPTRRYVDGREEMNGIRIQRLKNKLGTKALPTAEVEIKGMRAWLIGEEGRGVRHIAPLLSITRLYNAMSATGATSRGLSIVKAFSRVRTFPSRKAPDNVLRDLPLFAKTYAAVTLQHRADMLLTAFNASLLGAVEHPKTPVNDVIPERSQANLILRVLSSVTKAVTAKNTIHATQECMEGLGGVGYMENVESPEMNMARIFRDANVLAIWEGTTDVLATDTVKVLKGRDGGAVSNALGSWIDTMLTRNKKGPLEEEKESIKIGWNATRTRMLGVPEDVLARGRSVVQHIADVVCSVLLVADAERDNDPVAIECARRFAAGCFGPAKGARASVWTDVTAWDRRIVFEGEERKSKL